ncbi:uncharacterized protein LOC135145056 [Zophobas morio]|uniref:uncharacterized protein LOC135120548 n=1 Tax=Zophobas morio TaxID=2755281 RepID=UPI0030836A73
MHLYKGERAIEELSLEVLRLELLELSILFILKILSNFLIKSQREVLCPFLLEKTNYLESCVLLLSLATHDPYFLKVAGLRKELIRGVAVLSFEYLPAQNRARELGVLSLIAKQLEWDPMNQYIREWSIFAFRILEYNYQGTLES